MPTIKRKNRRARLEDFAELTVELEHFLKEGWCFFESFNSADDLRMAWGIHGERIVAEFVAEHPGRRPFGWWFCDHCKERPIINPWLTAGGIAREREKKFGFLDTHMLADCQPFQEPEIDYLKRLELLSAEELKLCQ